MKHIISTFTFAFALNLLALHAAVPLTWTVETTRVQPATFDVVRGETIALEASFNNAEKPFAMDGYDCALFWQTNGMGSAWWTAPAAAASNRVSATFTPEMDPGASTVIGFLGSTGQIYRASFQLRFRHGPGATPNALPLPVPVIDFAQIRVLNPPWSGGGGGGTDTNDVELIANRAVETNAVTVATTNRVTALETATNSLTSSVSSLTSSVSSLQSSKLDGPTVAPSTDASASGNAADAKATGDELALKRNLADIDVYLLGLQLPEPLTGLCLIRKIVDSYSYDFGLYNSSGEVSEIWGTGILSPDGKKFTVDYLIDGSYAPEPFFSVGSVHDVLNVKTENQDKLAKVSQIPTGDKLVSDADRTNWDGKADKTELAPIRTAANYALSFGRVTYDYMMGNTNAWFSGTNYVFGAESTNKTTFAFEDGMDLLTMPCSMALWEIRDGAKQCVWDQRDWTVWYWNFKIAQYRHEHDDRDAALRALIAQRAPLNWSSYTACGLTNPASDTTWLDTPKVVLSAGYAWQHQLTVDGVGYWGIEGNGFEIGGSGTNATLRITDWEGNEVFRITKGSARLAYIDRSSNVACGWDGEYMWFDMRTGDPANGIPAPQPMGEFTIDLLEPFFEEGDNCPAEVREYENRGNGVWRCYFRAKPGINANACFARFKVQTGTETTIEYATAPTISGGLIYNGVKIAPVIPQGANVGDTVTWKVVQ